MAEKQYIEREAVLESISGLTWYSKNKKGVLNIGAVNRKEAYYPAGNVFDAVESAPAADVAPVVHARWIDRDDKTWCSKCDASNKQYKPPYCPHCGARMDGWKHETDRCDCA